MNIDTSKIYCPDSWPSDAGIPYFYFFEKNGNGYNFVNVQIAFETLRLSTSKVEKIFQEKSISNTIEESREITKKEALDYIFEGRK